MGQKKKGRKGGGLPNLSQIRKHCKVKTQASQVAAAPQSEYYTTSFNTKFTRLQRETRGRRHFSSDHHPLVHRRRERGGSWQCLTGTVGGPSSCERRLAELELPPGSSLVFQNCRDLSNKIIRNKHGLR